LCKKTGNEFKMMGTESKNSSQLPSGFAKPRTRALHAGVPGNYIPCRSRGTRQSVFEIQQAPSAIFILCGVILKSFFKFIFFKRTLLGFICTSQSMH